jgi:hypothetical protein
MLRSLPGASYCNRTATRLPRSTPHRPVWCAPGEEALGKDTEEKLAKAFVVPCKGRT